MCSVGDSSTFRYHHKLVCHPSCFLIDLPHHHSVLYVAHMSWSHIFKSIVRALNDLSGLFQMLAQRFWTSSTVEGARGVIATFGLLLCLMPLLQVISWAQLMLWCLGCVGQALY